MPILIYNFVSVNLIYLRGFTGSHRDIRQLYFRGVGFVDIILDPRYPYRYSFWLVLGIGEQDV